MKHTQILTLVFFLFTIASVCATDSTNVYFDFDKSDLTKLEKQKLDEAIETHKSLKFDSIVISGHTDFKGSVFYNLKLSERRVNTVKKHLQSNFNCTLKSSFHSELIPVATNQTYKGRADNRRVEIAWYHSAKSTIPNIEPVNIVTSKKSVKKELFTDAETSLKVEDKKDNVEEILEPLTVEEETQLIKEKEQYLHNLLTEITSKPVVEKIDPKKEKVILTDAGTLVIVQKSSFKRKDGSEPKEVNVEIQEYYNYASYMKEGLMTMTADGQFLESEGMVHINATDENGEELELQKSMTIGMPETDEKTNGMLLYEGIETDTGVVWNLNKETPVYKKPFSLSYNQLIKAALNYAESQNKDLAILNTAYNSYQKKADEVGGFKGKDKKAIKQAMKEMTVEAYESSEEVQRIKEMQRQAELKKKEREELKKEQKKQEELTSKEQEGMLEERRKQEELRSQEREKILEEQQKQEEQRLSKKQRRIEERQARMEKYKEGDNYMQTSTKMGYINCDRLSSRRVRTNLNVITNKVTSNKDVSIVYALFPRVNGMMKRPAQGGKTKVTFGGIPKGESVKYIGLSYRGDDIYYAEHDMVATNEGAVKLVYRKIDEHELKMLLGEL